MNAEEIEQLAQTASLEPSTTLNKLALLMQRPASVAEMLDPSLLLQAVDLGSLDRARVAIENAQGVGARGQGRDVPLAVPAVPGDHNRLALHFERTYATDVEA